MIKDFMLQKLFESIPQLHALALGCLIRGMEFFWEQVIHLTRRHVHVQDILQSLSFCSNMETLHLQHTEEDSDEEEEEQEEAEEREIVRSVTSTNLHTISIDIDDFCGSRGVDVLSAVLAAATFPSITSMTIMSHSFCTWGNWPQDVFISFLSRSSCDLTTLVLGHVPIPDTDLSWASFLPSLVSLTVSDVRMFEEKICLPPAAKDTLLKSLTTSSNRPYGSSRQALVPNLRSIDLHAYGAAFSDQCFVDMVKSRWSSSKTAAPGKRVACLQTAVLRVVGRRFSVENYGPLRHLEKAGMQISVFDAKGRVK